MENMVFSLKETKALGPHIVIHNKLSEGTLNTQIWNYSAQSVSVRLGMGTGEWGVIEDGSHWEAAQEVIQLLITWLAARSDYTVRDINIFGRPLGYGETGSWGTAHRDEDGEWTASGKKELGVLTEGDDGYWEDGDEEYWNGEDDGG